MPTHTVVPTTALLLTKAADAAHAGLERILIPQRPTRRSLAFYGDFCAKWLRAAQNTILEPTDIS